MNSIPLHLHSEDRQEYERILDEALRSAPTRPELAAVGERLNPEQLRTMALNATALITAAAATEYQHYVKVREGEARARAGAVAAVLTPVLAGTAAAIFLLVGYVLKMLSPEPAFAKTMLTAGWVCGAVAVGAVVVAVAGLLLNALRNRPLLDTGPYGESGGEVTRAREAWHDALLERGILPFLQAALAAPGTAALRRTTPSGPSRMPHLGYDSPGFSSPDDGPEPGHRPDFSSPDFGGPNTSRSEQPRRVFLTSHRPSDSGLLHDACIAGRRSTTPRCT